MHRLSPAETRLKEGAHAHDSDQNRWESSLAAGRWRPVSALLAVSKNASCHARAFCVRVYLLIWLAGTASFVALGLVLWGIARTHPPLDVDRLRNLVVLLAFLAVPLARVGLGPSSLERNRHR